VSEPSSPSVEEVLHAAVGNLGGEDRPGQVQMAQAVREAMRRHEHLLVQAGTGTGKSLGYLVPAVLNDERVVVATATLALQHQLVQRDIPALLDAASDVLGERPEYAVLKGASATATARRRTPTRSGSRSRSTTASAWVRPSAATPSSVSPSEPASTP